MRTLALVPMSDSQLGFTSLARYSKKMLALTKFYLLMIMTLALLTVMVVVLVME